MILCLRSYLAIPLKGAIVEQQQIENNQTNFKNCIALQKERIRFNQSFFKTDSFNLT